jgi:hypothetical protein
MPKIYPETADNAGLVVTRRARQTGKLVSVYDSAIAGFESDPDLPWATLCEEHSSLVCHQTKELALFWISSPLTWCELCQAEQERSGEPD